MELVIENTLTFVEGSKIFLGHEPDNTFTEFYMSGTKLINKSAKPVLGMFDSLEFLKEPRRITSAPVKDFGIKTFPQIGSYGFYTSRFTPSSIVVLPINKKLDTKDMPVATIVDTGTDIHLDIVGDYECYRVTIRQDLLATEFITYDTSFDFTPMYTGECLITVVGHSNEIAITSKPFEQTMTLVDRVTPIGGGFVQSVNDTLPDMFGNVSITAPLVPFSDAAIAADDVKEAIVEVDAKIPTFKRGNSVFTDRDTSQTFTDVACTDTSLVTIVITSAALPQGSWSVTGNNGTFVVTSTAAETADITFDYYIQRGV